jgi:hypothetical protein
LIVQGHFLDRGAPRWTIGSAGLLCACALVVSALCAPRACRLLSMSP